MDEIINAEQARKNSSKIDEAQMFLIMEDIKRVSLKGEYSTYFFHSLREPIRNKLIELGYEVGKEEYERNETSVKISWKS